MISIRPANTHDAPTILGFIRALADYEHLTHQLAATEAQLHAHLFGPRPAAEVLMAFSDSEPAGYALFFPTFSTFLARPGIWLEDLFVLPTFRRGGVGTTLLAAVAQIAVDRECGRLEWSVLDWNEPALKLYRQRGATVLPDWRICRLEGNRIGQLAREGADRT